MKNLLAVAGLIVLASILVLIGSWDLKHSPIASSASSARTVVPMRPVAPPEPKPAVVFPQVTYADGSDGSKLYVKWDLFVDGSRFVLLGVAGCPTQATCYGVPKQTNGVAYLLTWPKLPFDHFCIDTLKVGAKQPITERSSGFVLSTQPGRGQPSISVRTEDGFDYISRLCFPHGDVWEPYLWLGNSSYEISQVMTFDLAGDVR